MNPYEAPQTEPNNPRGPITDAACFCIIVLAGLPVLAFFNACMAWRRYNDTVGETPDLWMDYTWIRQITIMSSIIAILLVPILTTWRKP